MVTAGLALLVASSFFYMIHFASYAHNGVGSPGSEGLGLGNCVVRP